MIAAKVANIEEVREQERLTQLRVLERQEKRAKVIGKDKKILITCVFFCFAIMSLFCFIEGEIARSGHQVMQLKAQINDVRNTNDRLALEINELSSLSRIEAYAVSELGMVYPDNSTRMYMVFSAEAMDVAFGRTVVKDKSAAVNDVVVTVNQDISISKFLSAVTDMVSAYFDKAALALSR